MAESPAPPAIALRNGTHDLGPLSITPETPGPPFSSNSGSKLKQARLLFQPAKSPPNHIKEEKIPQGTCSENMSRETPMDTVPSTVAEVPESLPADEKMDTGEGGGGRSLQDKSGPGTLDRGSGNTAKPQQVKLSKVKTEREQVREEARVKREAEKQRKEQEKRERREKKEQEERERRERREREELEKKERKEKREEERKKKEEERKKKEDEKNQKLEAKKKKDEEKRQVEEQAREEKLRREQMAKSKFLGFFSKLPKESTPKQVQPGITLAKPPQPSIGDKTEFDTALKNQDFLSGYIQECKSKKLRPDSRPKPKPTSQAASVPDIDDDDIMIVSSSPQPSPTPAARSAKFKLLQFHRNHRPAYYGTMCRRSSLISARNPLRKDEQLLDYEVDSDDEWEEEEPGESISESEGEEESGEDSDEDDGFFVPHGYLSEDEGENSDREAGEEDSHKQKQLAKAKAWEAEFARKCQPLKSVKVGCVWQRMGGEQQPSRDELFLQRFAAMALVEQLPVCIEATPNSQASSSSGNGNGSAESTRRPVPEEAMPDLIRLVHENPAGLNRLIKTFRMHWGAKVMAERDKSKADNPLVVSSAQPNTEVPKTPKTPQGQPDYESASGISKRQLEMKIVKIAAKEQRATSYKPLWYVHDSVLRQYGIEASTITTLVPLASPFAKLQLCDREKTKLTSPETPCSGNAKKGMKRKVGSTPSVKSLFEACAKSPKINTEPPKEKKPRLVTATELSSSSKSASVDPLHPNTSQSLLTQFHSQTPSNKPMHPLPTCTDQRCPAGGSQEVIVILTDDSPDALPDNPISKIENKVTNPATTCTSPTAPPPQSAAAICKLPKPLPPKQPHSNALQERTNQPPRQGAATVLQMEVQLPPEYRIDWKKLLANSNKVITNADVH